MAFGYDVFISYNRDDERQVTQIASELISRRVAVWLDKICLPLGQDWQKPAEQALQSCPVTIVCIGRHGLGNWQESEIRAALDLQKQTKERMVIPILLEESSPDTIPQFLKGHTWMDFRQGINQTGLDALANKLPKILPDQSSSPLQTVEALETEERKRIRQSVEKLANFLAQGKYATFFIGSGIDDAPSPVGPKTSYLARELLRETRLIDQNYDQLLPPFDLAGLYYAVGTDGNWNGGWVLEDRVRRLISQCSGGVAPTHEALAALIKLLQSGLRRRRAINPDSQLIVTTSLDVQTERALLRAGVSFTRVVQHQSATQITINEYEHVSVDEPSNLLRIDSGEEAQEAQLDRSDEVDCLIESFRKRTIELQSGEFAGKNILTNATPDPQQRHRPILYKLLGSQDVQYSCAISAGQYFEFAQNSMKNNCIPREITKIIGNTPAIFIGFGFLDPDLRLMYHLLLQEQFAVKTPFTSMRYALRLPPGKSPEDDYRRIEARIWDGIKNVVNGLGVTMLEEHGEVFLKRLANEVQAKL